MGFCRNVFCCERSMATVRNKRLFKIKSSICNFWTIFTRYFYYLRYNVLPGTSKDKQNMDKTIAQPFKREKMAEGKTLWIIAHFLGLSSLLTSVFINIAEPFKTAVSVVALLYAVVMTVRLIVSTLGTWEAYRQKRMENNERKRRFDIRRAHDAE